jgi:hypothetical protein
LTAQQQAVACFVNRYFALSPAEWDALPPEIQQMYLTQPIGVDDQ